MATERVRSESPATISEVAAAAGVGRSTAARSLGNYGYVSPELRERVLEAADKLGYRANALARSVSTGVSNTLGVVVADIGNPFFAGVVRGISDASREAGFSTIVLSTHEDLAEEQAAIGVLIDKRVDGMIVASAAKTAAEVAHLQGAVDHRIPVVLLDRAVPYASLDTVVIDNRQAARKAVELFVRDGHHRIGFVWGPPVATSVVTRRALLAATARNLWTDGERLRGYLDALDDAGIPFDGALVTTGEKTEDAAAQGVTAMLSLADPPTAILSSETDALTGTLRAMRALGLSYPSDVSLIGFDDSSWAAVMNPPLSMIEQPLLRLGALATERLLRRIDGEASDAETHTLATRLIARESTGAPILPARV